MIHPASGFWRIFGPLGPTAGPGSPGNGSGSKIAQAAPKISPGGQFSGPFMGTLCIWNRPQKDKKINGKSEAPQGLPVRLPIDRVPL